MVRENSFYLVSVFFSNDDCEKCREISAKGECVVACSF